MNGHQSDPFSFAPRREQNWQTYANFVQPKKVISFQLHYLAMTVQKPSKPSKPSTGTGPSNLFGFIGIAAGMVAIGAYVKPFIPNPFDFAVFNVANTSVPLTQETFMSRYENGCPLHQFESIVQVSRVPNIMLIDGFITPEETEVILRVAYLPLLPLPDFPLHNG